MKLSLICCGLSHLMDGSVEGQVGGFYRLPRISIARNSQQFLPDFSMLLLADELVMGRQTYEATIRGQVESGPTMALMLKMLHDEGFVRLEDFDGAIRQHQSLLELMSEEGLEDMAGWVPTMKKAVDYWQSYFEGLQLTLRPRIEKIRQEVTAGTYTGLNYARAASVFVHHMGGRYQMVRYYSEEVLGPGDPGQEAETLKERRQFLSEQLAYALSNVLLGRKFTAALHDWCDFDAHYRKIFQTARDHSLVTPRGELARELFQVTTPEFVFWDPDKVICALRDERVKELRARIKDSILGKTDFDATAANRTLDAVSEIEPGVTRVRVVNAATISVPEIMNGVSPEANGRPVTLQLPPVHFTSQSIDAALADRKREEVKAM